MIARVVLVAACLVAQVGGFSSSSSAPIQHRRLPRPGVPVIAAASKASTTPPNKNKNKNKNENENKNKNLDDDDAAVSYAKLESNHPMMRLLTRTRPKKKTKKTSALRGGGSAMMRAACASVALAALSTLTALTSPASAIENAAQVGRCVLTQCQVPLIKCLGSPKCAANLACLQTCNGRKDEIECQIRCGDLFENPAVGEFNACAVSQKKCVPQRSDDGAYPIPPDTAVIKAFDTKSFEGRWYISAGLNKIFDTFDCQIHFFTAPTSNTLYGKLNWRIDEPDGEFFTRDTVQRFVQSSDNPGLLLNHDNEYLHYEDDWYVLDAQPGIKENDENAFVLVYYRGRNDAWDGYGGAVLYTRTPYASESVKRRAAAACEKTGLFSFADFAEPRNECPSEPRPAQKLLLREKYASRLLLTAEKDIQEEATLVRKNAANTFKADVREVVQATAKLERQIADYEKAVAADLVKVEEVIVDDIVKGAEEVVEDVVSIRGKNNNNNNKASLINSRQ